MKLRLIFTDQVVLLEQVLQAPVLHFTRIKLSILSRLLKLKQELNSPELEFLRQKTS